jgi:cyclic beta-1,2-glucan synthetase
VVRRPDGKNWPTSRLLAEPLLTSYHLLARRAEDFVREMDFSFLYHGQRQVFHIGYNLENGRLDPNYYDLLASEARIASIVAIAKRDVPQEHWLHLARPFTALPQGLALLSWSGTMFEYLMPPLLVRSYAGTLLENSCAVIVEHQIAYGRQHNIPWGISESGFYTFDSALNYQYRAFGVPGAGFKRGLADDLVIAPYASLLALAIRPGAVLNNLSALAERRMIGPYGLYEALDFTASRLKLGQSAAIVQSYMAHHQGMILLALLNYLQNDKMVARFHAEPAIRSVELLLQEQIPSAPPRQNPREDEDGGEVRPTEKIMADPWAVPVETPLPLVHYLSNGRFNSLITNAGSGYLAGSDIAYTRWRPDTTLDNWGLWLYVQDMASGALWSAGLQPTTTAPQTLDVQFYPHMVQFRRRHDDVVLQLDVVVAPDDDVEIRLLHLTNDSDQPRHLRLTSYGEVVLTAHATDIRHPAFAKLFVESEYLPEENALFFRRRPRSAEEPPIFMGHMLVRGEMIAMGERSDAALRVNAPRVIAYESDRAQFLGRHYSPAWPAALQRANAWLSGTTGATLDPIMALGHEVTLPPRSSLELAWLTFAADSRPGLLTLAHEYRRWSIIRRAFTQARTQAEQEMRRLELSTTDLAQTQRLLSLLLYPHAAARADDATLAANSLGQPALWSFGISGDYPILLLRVTDEKRLTLLPTLLRAHTYWRRRGLRIDLVIVNQQESNYGQPAQNAILRTIEGLESAHWLNQRGGIFVLREDQMSQAEATLLYTAARVALHANDSSLPEQLARLDERPMTLPEFVPPLAADAYQDAAPPLQRPDNLRHDNGLGGFSPDGREYVIFLEPGVSTPAPWINVIANEQFGFLASETGGGYSWATNSGENRLTAWRNDPVLDRPSEVIYLRDEETAVIWSPTPQPTPANAPYEVRHGAGYTTFTHHSHGLKQHLRLFAAPDAPVKIAHLRLENVTAQPRRLTVTYYAEWVLGVDRAQTQPFLIPAYHPAQCALLVRNPYNVEFGTAVAFLAASREPHGLTANRTEFLGRLGGLGHPAGLRRIGLSNQVQPGLDCAGVLQIHVDLPPGGVEEVYFLLGQEQDEAAALALVEWFGNPTAVETAWRGVHDFWDEVLGTVSVATPDPALDLLLNRWLLYQALACRIWGRSALYQSSGAYGYRDQLQDVMALLHARPDIARAQLLRAAAHQFEAGDVLHWWHPPSGRGVRTRITDDLVWLPFVTAVYIQTTGDHTVLDDGAPFLVGQPLAEGEEERYNQYASTSESFSLYEHCCRALTRAATQGRNGLPLIGGGDWNDGMNRVGIGGQGESVWLGWFLAQTLRDFAPLCRARNDHAHADLFLAQAEAYRVALEAAGWDGEWYRRGYYDDGMPLGSQENAECRIDAIAQSWGVLSGLADAARARQAMTAVQNQLIRPADRLILLFTPPFNKTRRDPGYIKGYLPGIRENGGQYTHAALWTIWALAELGDGEQAEALFRMINPIYRADTPAKAAHYVVEPYVVAADVYGVSPHEGRGGWTWYTGSSGWMYRLGLEGILGLKREGASLRLEPHIPANWPGFKITYRYGRSRYEIVVENQTNGVERPLVVTLNGKRLADGVIPLQDDGRYHRVLVQLGLR